MVGDNESLMELAHKYLEMYTLEELLELNDIIDEELIYLLLINGLIKDDLVTEL